MSSSNGLKVGDSVDQFDIVERLGEGGMGEVYLANDNQLKRKVALKLVIPGRSGETELIERFLVEARTLATLDHSNIVRVYSIGRFGRGHYLVLEYVEGQSLNDVLKSRNLGVKESVLYLQQICDGLKMCHENGIIHRDIKPHNLLVRSDGLVKIVDFGIAKAIGADSKDLNITQENMIIGTPLYLSPEVVSGAAPSNQSDIFSLGVTFFYMLTGRLPFGGKNQLELLENIRNQEAEFTQEDLDRIPEVFVRITQKMLEKKLQDRYKSFTEVIEDIDSLPIEELKDDRPVVVEKKYNVVNEPALQLKLLQKGLTRAEVQLVLNNAAESVLRGQVSPSESYDPDSTMPLSMDEVGEEVSQGPITIPSQVLEEHLNQLLAAKSGSSGNSGGGSKKSGTLLPFFKRTKKQDVFATKATETKDKSGRKTIAEEVLDDQKTRTAKTPPKAIPFQKIVFWNLFLISAGVLGVFMYMPFEHPKMLQILVFGYLGFAIGAAGVFSNPIFRTSIPVLLINIVFLAWIMPERPVEDVEEFRDLVVKNISSYEGYSTDSKQFFHLSDKGVLRRSLARAYVEIGLNSGVPAHFKKAYKVLLGKDYFLKLSAGETKDSFVVKNQTSVGKLVGNQSIAPGDFTVSELQGQRVAVYLGELNWLIEDTDAKVIKIYKGPMMSRRMIYRLKSSLIRIGAPPQDSQAAKSNPPKETRILVLPSGERFDVTNASPEQIQRLKQKGAMDASGGIKPSAPILSVDGTGRKPANR